MSYPIILYPTRDYATEVISPMNQFIRPLRQHLGSCSNTFRSLVALNHTPNISSSLFHTTRTNNNNVHLEHLRMLPEFVQAEEHFYNGDPTSATISLERVQNICDSSMGIDSPMAQAVHSMMLQYLTFSFSNTSTSNLLTTVAHQSLLRQKSNYVTPEDLAKKMYLCIVTGRPDLAISISSSSSASIDTPLLMIYRGIALATNGKSSSSPEVEEAHKLFQNAQEIMVVTENEKSTSEILRVQIAHNIGCMYHMDNRKEEALSMWTNALELAADTSTNATTNNDDDDEQKTRLNSSKVCQIELLCNIGSHHTEEGDPSEGILCLSRAVELLGALSNENDENVENGDTTPIQMARPLTLLGRAHHADGRAVSAEGYFRSAMGLLGEKKELSPSMQLQYIETLRMYASLLIDWEQRKTDYDHQMNEVNQLNQKMIGENRVPMKIGMSLPLPRPQ